MAASLDGGHQVGWAAAAQHEELLPKPLKLSSKAHELVSSAHRAS
jgi:hypothetical protein